LLSKTWTIVSNKPGPCSPSSHPYVLDRCLSRLLSSNSNRWML